MGFEKLLKMINNMFPKDNKLPASTYKAKMVVCPLDIEVQKIHACPNDCILYRGEEYENLDACPVCSALRYKIRREDPGDVEGEPPQKRVPAKVMWYAPIIPRLNVCSETKSMPSCCDGTKKTLGTTRCRDTPLMGRSGEKSIESSSTLQVK